jgi:hypothetical protein
MLVLLHVGIFVSAEIYLNKLNNFGVIQHRQTNTQYSALKRNAHFYKIIVSSIQ